MSKGSRVREALEKLKDDIRMLDFEYNNSEYMSAETHEQKRKEKIDSVLSDLAEIVWGKKLLRPRRR